MVRNRCVSDPNGTTYFNCHCNYVCVIGKVKEKVRYKKENKQGHAEKWPLLYKYVADTDLAQAQPNISAWEY